MSDDRRSLGSRGEAIAALHLKSHGFKILHQNYRCRRGGEIDIIAEDQDYIVFIEVKTRATLSHGSPAHSVDRRKQLQIAHAAQNYLTEYQLHDSPARFDVIAILLDGDGKEKIDHIKNAFEL